MAEKWEIVKKPFEREIVREVEYGVFAKNGKELIANVTSRKDARLIAASPLMLEALHDALDYIQFGMTPEEDVLQRIAAALKAAKGE